MHDFLSAISPEVHEVLIFAWRETWYKKLTKSTFLFGFGISHA